MVKIYTIENSKNGKSYVGCTAGKIEKRWREHRCLLRAGKHQCKALQKDWDRDGESIFRIAAMYILREGATVLEKRSEELQWMVHYQQQGLLYNEHIISFQPPPGFHDKAIATRKANGYRPSPESNLKRRLAQLGKPKGHGAKISATKQAKRAMR